MSFHFFTVLDTNPEAAQDELNALARERVLNVQRQFVAERVNSFATFCVDVGTGPRQWVSGRVDVPGRKLPGCSVVRGEAKEAARVV